MRKNSPKKESSRLHASVMRGVLALVLVGLLAVPIAVQAELKAVSLAYSWDDTTNEFEWGRVVIEFDVVDEIEEERWIPLLQEIRFDDLYDREPEDEEPEICEGHDLTVQYSGWLEYGLPSLDTDPLGAEGFQGSSEYWYLIDCDLNGDTEWDRDDLTAPMPLEPVAPEDWNRDLVTCSAGNPNCEIRYRDQRQGPPPATSQHCIEEKATQLVIRLDTNCDGTVDGDDEGDATRLAEVAGDTGLCVYSWAKMPSYEPGEDIWSFPLPVRITDADGAKTLMLELAPTAVELASFKAEPQGRDVLVSWETASELDNLGFNLYRSKAGGERARLNDWLIASTSPGSTVGSSYQFVDRSAEPGMAYHYWLEDIDFEGVAGMNGPLAVQMPRSRFLPCRPRPAPMPQSQ